MVEDIADLKLVDDDTYFELVQNCNQSDIILIKKNNKHEDCSGKPLVFATSYVGIKNYPESVGAFFYQKGRPNIIFNKKVLDKRDIKISQKFNKYIE